MQALLFFSVLLATCCLQDSLSVLLSANKASIHLLALRLGMSMEYHCCLVIPAAVAIPVSICCLSNGEIATHCFVIAGQPPLASNVSGRTKMNMNRRIAEGGQSI